MVRFSVDVQTVRGRSSCAALASVRVWWVAGEKKGRSLRPQIHGQALVAFSRIVGHEGRALCHRRCGRRGCTMIHRALGMLASGKADASVCDCPSLSRDMCE